MNYYITCKDCNQEVNIEETYECNECGQHLCFECYLEGDGQCEECYIDQISNLNI